MPVFIGVLVALVVLLAAWAVLATPRPTAVTRPAVASDFWHDHVDGSVVYVTVGWERATVTNPVGRYHTAEFAVRRLLEVCRSLEVAPIGTLEIEEVHSEALDLAQTCEYILRLDVGWDLDRHVDLVEAAA